jgi:hypothetical protein
MIRSLVRFTMERLGDLRWRAGKLGFSGRLESSPQIRPSCMHPTTFRDDVLRCRVCHSRLNPSAAVRALGEIADDVIK